MFIHIIYGHTKDYNIIECDWCVDAYGVPFVPKLRYFSTRNSGQYLVNIQTDLVNRPPYLLNQHVDLAAS